MERYIGKATNIYDRRSGHYGWRWISVLTMKGWTAYLSLGAGNAFGGGTGVVVLATCI
jgi:hypothetical protein